MFNKLLQRQINKFLSDNELPEVYLELLQAVSNSYDHYEEDRNMLERSMELASQEMIELNKKIRQDAEELNTLVNNIQEVFFSMDMLTYETTSISQACENVYGYPANAFIENSNLWCEVVLEEDKERIDTKQALLQAGKTFTQEYRIRHKNGSIKWLETKITPTLIDGKLIRIDGITADVTKRKEADEELKANNAELKKRNMELDKFVYSVSHDLRAPLRSILGVVELSEDMTDDNIMLKHFDMIKGSIKRLDGFVVDMLDYSRNSRVEVESEKIDFKEVLDNIKNNLKYMGNNNREVEIINNVKDGTFIKSDRSRITIILNNLISNAIRYQNPKVEKPHVAIDVVLSDSEAKVAVRDNGIGINKEQKEKIFEMFYRVSSNSVGSGLGLYIVKEAVQKLNGQIEVQSEPEKGTTMTVFIPNTN